MPSVDDLHPIRCDGDQHFFRRFGEIQGGVGWAFEASPEPMPAEWGREIPEMDICRYHRLIEQNNSGFSSDVWLLDITWYY